MWSPYSAFGLNQRTEHEQQHRVSVITSLRKPPDSECQMHESSCKSRVAPQPAPTPPVKSSMRGVETPSSHRNDPSSDVRENQ